MKMKMLAVYDSKVEAFMTPMFFQSVGQAMRSFGDAVQNAESEFAKHPEDYVLFEIADFNPSTGSLEVLPAAKSVASGLQFARAEES